MCKDTVKAAQSARSTLQRLQRDFGKEPGTIESRTETYIESGVKLRAYETIQLYEAARTVNRLEGAANTFRNNLKTMFNM